MGHPFLLGVLGLVLFGRSYILETGETFRGRGETEEGVFVGNDQKKGRRFFFFRGRGVEEDRDCNLHYLLYLSPSFGFQSEPRNLGT